MGRHGFANSQFLISHFSEFFYISVLYVNNLRMKHSVNG